MLSLEQTLDEWAEFILEKVTKNKRKDESVKIREAGYDIELEAEKLMGIYDELIER